MIKLPKVKLDDVANEAQHDQIRAIMMSQLPLSLGIEDYGTIVPILRHLRVIDYGPMRTIFQPDGLAIMRGNQEYAFVPCKEMDDIATDWFSWRIGLGVKAQ